MIAKVRRRSTSVAIGEGFSAPNDVRTGIFMAGWMWQFRPSRSRPAWFYSAGKLFAHDLKFKPSLLRYGNLPLEFCERGGDTFKGDTVPRVKSGIVELRSKCLGFGLECRDGLGQGIERMLVLEAHSPLGGRRLRIERN